MKNNYKGKKKDFKKNFWEDFRFEFVLYINNGRRKEDGNNIICQRLFDVKGYNEEALKSLEVRDLMDTIAGTEYGSVGQMGIIPNHFKKLCKKASWDTYNPYRIKVNEDNKDVFEHEDVFTFEIKIDKKVALSTQFSGNWFQTDVRYQVNIRDIIPEIIEEIQEFLSRNEYTTTYEGYDLKFQFPAYDFKAD